MTELMSARANDLLRYCQRLDYTDWDPASDPRIAKTFSVEDFGKNKVLNKKALQEELGLEKDTKTMMIGMISRLQIKKDLILSITLWMNFVRMRFRSLCLEQVM